MPSDAMETRCWQCGRTPLCLCQTAVVVVPVCGCNLRLSRGHSGTASGSLSVASSVTEVTRAAHHPMSFRCLRSIKGCQRARVEKVYTMRLDSSLALLSNVCIEKPGHI